MSPPESPHTTNPMPPAVALRQLLYGYRISQAIYVAAKLDLADVLKDGPQGKAATSWPRLSARTRRRCIGCCECSPVWGSSPRSTSVALP
jgi:hypothetical protein